MLGVGEGVDEERPVDVEDVEALEDIEALNDEDVVLVRIVLLGACETLKVLDVLTGKTLKVKWLVNGAQRYKVVVVTFGRLLGAAMRSESAKDTVAPRIGKTAQRHRGRDSKRYIVNGNENYQRSIRKDDNRREKQARRKASKNCIDRGNIYILQRLVVIDGSDCDTGSETQIVECTRCRGMKLSPNNII